MKYSLFIFTVIIIFFGCEKKYKDVAYITHFVEIQLNGDNLVFTPSGIEYNDLGAIATENGDTVKVTTVSDVDTDNVGSYTVQYTATNSEGFSKTEERKVVVYDANTLNVDISGIYNADVKRGSEHYTGNKVELKPTGINGVCYISDWVGGFYTEGRGYEDAYVFEGIIQINKNNEVLELDMNNRWNKPFDDVVGTYNTITGDIKYNADFVGKYTFIVELSK